jgi:hypothetical protein
MAVRTKPYEAVVAPDDLELEVTALYVIGNDWWFRDGEKPDVRIVGYRLTNLHGQGDVDVSFSFFGPDAQRAWEKEIAGDMESLADAQAEEMRFGGGL